MVITNEMRWEFIRKYWDEFRGEIFNYEDGSFQFSPCNREGTDGGKDLESFVDKMIRREKKNASTVKL
jgi:hypothetical protein